MLVIRASEESVDTEVVRSGFWEGWCHSQKQGDQTGNLAGLDLDTRLRGRWVF